MADGLALTCWVHNGEQVAYSWASSMFGFHNHVFEHEDCPARGGVLPILYGTGGLVEARNTAVEKFLATECDWLFWIDTDMGFRPDTLDRLLAVADPVTAPMVGALCLVNKEVDRDGMGGYVTRPAPTTFVWAKNPDGTVGFVPRTDYTPGSVVRVDATGSACVVIHRRLFELFPQGNWYGLVASPDGRPFGEDMSFCVRLAQHDVPIHVHTGVHTTHLKPVWLTERHIEWVTPPAVASMNRETRRKRRAS